MPALLSRHTAGNVATVATPDAWKMRLSSRGLESVHLLRAFGGKSGGQAQVALGVAR